MTRALVPALLLLLAGTARAGVHFDGVDDDYRGNVAPVTGPPYTIACWVRQTYQTIHYPVSIANSGDNVNHVYLRCSHWTAPLATVALVLSVSGLLVETETTTLTTTGVWEHWCGVVTSTTSRAVYLNGGGKGTSTTSISPSGLNRTAIGVLGRASPNGWFGGDVADVAIWSVALTDDEVLALAGGLHPYRVRPRSIVAYYPLRAHDTSGARDAVGANSLTTISSSPTSTDSPPIRRPVPQYSRHYTPLRYRPQPRWRDDEEVYRALAA